MFYCFLEALSYLPTSEVRTTRESYTTAGFGRDELDRRFHYTGERDFSREPSFLHTTSPPVLLQPPLQQSTPERINQFGYDLNEVQTSGMLSKLFLSHFSIFRRWRKSCSDAWWR